MKKTLTQFIKRGLIMFVCFFVGFSVFAQTQTIKGKITGADGAGMPGVSIQQKGTISGTISDDNGVYSLENTKSDAVIVFSFVGFNTQEITVGNQTSIDVTLLEEKKQLEEVVVTALGIKKGSRTIGYSTQDVKGEDLIKAREPNAVNSLVGKVAGLTVSTSAEMLGRPVLILRGNSDLLFVVDGVPINSDTWNISSDDIETYSVLKGPNAAALYGFRGQNGAIMITTKKGLKEKGKLQVEFNSSTMLESGFIALPQRQNEYGYGNNYQYAFGNKPYDEDGKFRRPNEWGPRFEGQLIPQYDSPVDPATGIRQGTPWIAKGANNFKNFMENGLLSNNNLSITSSGEKYDLRLSVSNNFQKGTAPNTSLNGNNINLYTGYKITDKLKLEGNINLSLQNSPNIPEQSSGPESYTYIFNVYGSASWDVRDIRDYYKAPQGKQGVQQVYAEYGRENNPWFMAYEWLREHQKTDLFGYVKATYDFNKDFSLSLRSQVTTWDQLRTEKLPYSTITYKQPDLRQGDYREDKRNLFENNTDLLLSYNKQIGKDFRINAVAGGNLRTFRYNSSLTSTDFLIVPGVYDFSNSKNAVIAYNFRSAMEVASGYYSADFTFKNLLTLSTTGRVDKLSTLPASQNTDFYPSVSVSTVVSDYVKLPEVVSFFKLRASYANVRGGLTQSTIGTAYKAITGSNLNSLIGYGQDLVSSYDGPSYANQNTYKISNNTYNGQVFADYSSSLANPTLKPFTSASYEGGADIKFFKDRLSLDVTYFQTVNGPQIFPLPVAGSSGFTSQTVNAVVTERKGWEIGLTGKAIRNPRGFNWDVLFNISTYKETLKEVSDGVSSIYLAGPDHVFNVGDRLDGYYGYGFLHSPDGQVIVSASGTALGTPSGTNNKKLLGYTNPDYVWALNNKFSYKNFSFSFQVDGRVGGVIYDQVYAYATNAGNQAELSNGALGAARLAEWNSTATGTKAATPAYVAQGVSFTGTAKFDAAGNISNFNEITFAPNTKTITVKDYVQNLFNVNDENWLVSKTYLKLREVVIGYTLPNSFFKKSDFIKSASFSLVGRNLLYFAKRTDFDLDQYGAGYSASNNSTLKDPSLQSATSRRFGFNINVVF